MFFVKAAHSLTAVFLVLTVTVGVVCALACPHEIVAAFCPSGQHDCCPKDSGPNENCLSTHFTSSTKFEMVAILPATIIVEDITRHISPLPHFVDTAEKIAPNLRSSVIRI